MKVYMLKYLVGVAHVLRENLIWMIWGLLIFGHLYCISQMQLETDESAVLAGWEFGEHASAVQEWQRGITPYGYICFIKGVNQC